MDAKLILAVALVASLVGNITQAILAKQNEAATAAGQQILAVIRDQQEVLAKTQPENLAAIEKFLGQEWVKAVRTSSIPSNSK
ncbi:hypothetical protein [Chromobacterium haemolyticum]|uniref:hypothetical protein n=1 Tax=Chromobacterium haemolyticum TaxID=394935 RepID=UPI00244D5A89|nr:hypothetical protein [Chromobacterium haemolyticum]MDH0341984.1 hypothetical protein [Chromobacterium haemolyticum]